jgi:hypothetical protein
MKGLNITGILFEGFDFKKDKENGYEKSKDLLYIMIKI